MLPMRKARVAPTMTNFAPPGESGVPMVQSTLELTLNVLYYSPVSETQNRLKLIKLLLPPDLADQTRLRHEKFEMSGCSD